MLRRTLPLIALALATAGVLAPAAPAAAASGTTSAGPVVLYDQCQRVPLDYSVAADGSAWRLQLRVFDPDGLTSEGFVASSSDGAAPTGRFEMTFCGSETPGTWTVRSTLCAGLTCFLADQGGSPLTDSTFEVRRAQTTTTLGTKRLHDRHRYQLTASVQREQPAGFAPAQGVYVRFEKLVDGTWVPLSRRDVPTAGAGASKQRLTVRRGTTVRAVVPGVGNYSGSTSAPVRLRR